MRKHSGNGNEEILTSSDKVDGSKKGTWMVLYENQSLADSKLKLSG